MVLLKKPKYNMSKENPAGRRIDGPEIAPVMAEKNEFPDELFTSEYQGPIDLKNWTLLEDEDLKQRPKYELGNEPEVQLIDPKFENNFKTSFSSVHEIPIVSVTLTNDNSHVKSDIIDNTNVSDI
jgi:hypothetical protein